MFKKYQPPLIAKHHLKILLQLILILTYIYVTDVKLCNGSTEQREG